MPLEFDTQDNIVASIVKDAINSLNKNTFDLNTLTLEDFESLSLDDRSRLFSSLAGISSVYQRVAQHSRANPQFLRPGIPVIKKGGR